MFHGYCIRLAEHAPPDPGLAGVDGNRVALLEREGLGIWISEATEARPSVRRLREHERVVRSALRTGTPLPLRFGTTFRDEREIAEALRERRQEFARLLREMADRVEMGLRIVPLEPASRGAAAPVTGPPPATGNAPGREYLEARRRALEVRSSTIQAARALVDRVDRSFADLGLRSVKSVLPGTPPVGSLAHLVQRPTLPAYRNRVEQVARSADGARIEVSGPWAPYSFVR